MTWSEDNVVVRQQENDGGSINDDGINTYAMAMTWPGVNVVVSQQENEGGPINDYDNTGSVCGTLEYDIESIEAAELNFDLRSPRLQQQSPPLPTPTPLFSRASTPVTEALTVSFDRIWSSDSSGDSGSVDCRENEGEGPVSIAMEHHGASIETTSTLVPEPSVIQGLGGLFGSFGTVLAELQKHEVANTTQIVIEEELESRSNGDDAEDVTVTSSSMKKKPPKTCRCDQRCQFGAGAVILLLFVVTIFCLLVFSVLLAGKDNPGNDQSVNSNSDLPAPSPSSRESSGVTEKVAGIVGAALMANSTPHSQALDWILHKDPMKLSKSSPNLLQRYGLALFYFSTSSTPWKSCNPPSVTNGYNETCDFVRVFGTTLTFTQLPHLRWLSSSHECGWAGVSCGWAAVNDDSRVVEVQLDGHKLSGSLPNDFGLLLPELTVVSIAHNNLTGSLHWVNGMEKLKVLQLQHNQFSGSIPSGFFDVADAELINLASNRFSEGLPTEIGLLGPSSLQGLFLSDNPMLTGTIPSEVAALGNLVSLQFSRTQLDGQLPSEIGKLTNLQYLSGGDTELTGTLPSFLAQMSKLRHLRLQNTKIGGFLPQELYNLTNLERLHLWQANLRGTLSADIGRMSNLVSLRLHNNSLTGLIPSQMGLLTNLETLYLHSNGLDGTVPFCNNGMGHREDDGVSITEITADCLPSTGFDAPVDCECCAVCCDAFDICVYV